MAHLHTVGGAVEADQTVAIAVGHLCIARRVSLAQPGPTLVVAGRHLLQVAAVEG
jgi:hypothetical protein